MSATATNIPVIVVTSAFAIAFVMGAIAQRTNFCIMGAVSDVMNMGDWGRMRMWMLAVAVAIAGAGGLYASGAIDLSKSLYTRPTVPWIFPPVDIQPANPPPTIPTYNSRNKTLWIITKRFTSAPLPAIRISTRW